MRSAKRAKLLTWDMTEARSEPLRRRRLGGYEIALLPRRRYEACFTPRAAVIGFAFDGQSGDHAFASDRRRAFRARPNSLAFVPPGCEVYSSSPKGGEYLTIAASRAEVSERRFSDVVDRSAMTAAESIRKQLLCDDLADPLALEAQVLELQERVETVLGGQAPAVKAATWMTGYRVRRVEELIEAGLAGGISVQGLADALGLSAGFFTRAFTAAMASRPTTSFSTDGSRGPGPCWDRVPATSRRSPWPPALPPTPT